MAWNACISQTAVFYSYRANALHRDEAKGRFDGLDKTVILSKNTKKEMKNTLLL